VWVFRSTSAEAASAASLLTEDEQARVERAHALEARQRFAAVRGTLRQILSGYLDMEPLRVPIAYGPQGKPHLAPELGSTLCFSVSHSGPLAAIAVRRAGEVGVDVELRRPRERLPRMADALLSPAERSWYEQLPADERVCAFFDLWSAKEACSKLIGRGITMRLSAISLADPAAAVTEVEVDHPAAREAPCFLHRLAVEPEYSGALALEWPAESRLAA
jgi:4'-phosphopantetheinyl transferase